MLWNKKSSLIYVPHHFLPSTIVSLYFNIFLVIYLSRHYISFCVTLLPVLLYSVYSGTAPLYYPSIVIYSSCHWIKLLLFILSLDLTTYIHPATGSHYLYSSCHWISLLIFILPLDLTTYIHPATGSHYFYSSCHWISLFPFTIIFLCNYLFMHLPFNVIFSYFSIIFLFAIQVPCWQNSMSVNF